jgi:Domain of unknown function (DUF3846)
MKRIEVIIVEPNQPARIETIPNTLEAKQKIVGGYIEVIRMDGFDIIINEEGKLIDLEPNFGIYGGQDYVAGTAIFAGVNYETGDFKSLNEVQKTLILRNFEERGN